MEELLTLSELYTYGVGLLLSGFVLSFIPIVIGVIVEGFIKIFKKA